MVLQCDWLLVRGSFRPVFMRGLTSYIAPDTSQKPGHISPTVKKTLPPSPRRRLYDRGDHLEHHSKRGLFLIDHYRFLRILRWRRHNRGGRPIKHPSRVSDYHLNIPRADYSYRQ
jgi:hypothetical protein